MDRALDALLRPGSIAVVGASDDPTTIAGLLFANLVASGFDGPVMPVNPHHSSVQGLPAYPDLASCPAVADLAIVCVPARAVPDVVAQAGELGVRIVCVISAGFAELGEDGVALQAAMMRAASAGGVRVVGPNCTGIMSNTGEGRFNATFSRVVPPAGRTMLLSQSGAIGLAVLEAADARGLGIGALVSVGNSADLSANDLLAYWGEDASADLILAYLESIPQPQEFVRVASSIRRRVPIVVVKAGRSEAGRRGAASHTAALSGGDAGVDALLAQAGVIRAASIQEMLDLAAVLGTGRRLPGRRVAVLTNGGGPGVLAADACEANGLVVPALSESTASELRAVLAAEASVSNPVDMIASATAQQYGRAVRILGADPQVDVVVVIFNTPLITRSEDVAAELLSAQRELENKVAIVAVFMNREGTPLLLREAAFPSFSFPEDAARALGQVASWQERQARPPGSVPEVDLDMARIGELVAAARRRTTDGWMAEADAEALLREAGIGVARSRLVRTPEEAADAQADLGRTVAVKVASAAHKTEMGGVRLGLTTASGAAEALSAMREALEAAGAGALATEFLVQEQIRGGQEMIVGLDRDPTLGPLVVVGLGGTLVELFKDAAVRVAPLTDQDVEDMLSSLASYPLLDGYRGRPRLDTAALRAVLHRVSALAEAVPEVDEMDLNPVVVQEAGAVVVDARIRLTPSAVSQAARALVAQEVAGARPE